MQYCTVKYSNLYFDFNKEDDSLTWTVLYHSLKTVLNYTFKPLWFCKVVHCVYHLSLLVLCASWSLFMHLWSIRSLMDFMTFDNPVTIIAVVMQYKCWL
jgi:hypothetical protein